jgi:hypothetical protein
MPRKKVTMYYEVTRRRPTPTPRKGSVRALIWEALCDLKRADLAKITAVVTNNEHFRTIQERSSQPIYLHLYHFVREGVVKQMPDRRYRGVRGRGF